MRFAEPQKPPSGVGTGLGQRLTPRTPLVGSYRKPFRTLPSPSVGPGRVRWGVTKPLGFLLFTAPCVTCSPCCSVCAWYNPRTYCVTTYTSTYSHTLLSLASCTAWHFQPIPRFHYPSNQWGTMKSYCLLLLRGFPSLSTHIILSNYNLDIQLSLPSHRKYHGHHRCWRSTSLFRISWVQEW